MAANNQFTYQFCDNQNRKAYQSMLAKELTVEVTPQDLADSGIDAAEQVPLQCFDNVIETLVKNHGTTPGLRFCLGLQQDTVEIEKVVEHCWLERDGEYFDSSPELKNSRYFLFCSLALEELLGIMVGYELDHPPNISKLLELRNQVE
ncbi:MAG: hypothetical protein CL840_15595 [Crocinitomicaceae bacterium]|nr:hypothetical protein [Crocinitomicaceae bacterium]|tara:strand:+ start:61170 stop:61613 length:444 start_codon:yes stop_codon:yes gene_type:complete